MDPEKGDAQADSLWKTMKKHIHKGTRSWDMEDITLEDLERGIQMLKANTVVGIDQWSPHHWKQIDIEAKEA